MQVTTKITVDLTRQNVGQRVNAVQGDGNTRLAEITLLCGGLPWTPPEGVEAAIAYMQPGGTKGMYNLLADGTPAISMAGNVATIVLAPQMLTASGTVQASLVFNDAKLNRLTTFPFAVSVTSNPAAGAQKTEDYIRLQWLEDKLDEYLRKAADSGAFDGKPGDNGVTFTPSVSENGDISWRNNGGLPNPQTVNIRGPQGDSKEATAAANAAQTSAANAETHAAAAAASAAAAQATIGAMGTELSQIKDDLADITYIVKSLNIFDENTMVSAPGNWYHDASPAVGHVISLSAINSNVYSGLKITTDGQSAISLKCSGRITIPYWYAVDENMVCLAYGHPDDWLNTQNGVTISIPSNTKYLLVSASNYKEQTDSGNHLMVVAGNTPMDYEPYVAPKKVLNIPSGAVGTEQLLDEAVTSVKIKNHSISIDKFSFAEIGSENLFDENTMITKTGAMYKSGEANPIGKAVTLYDSSAFSVYTAICVPFPFVINTLSMTSKKSAYIPYWYAVDANDLVVAYGDNGIQPFNGATLQNIPDNATKILFSVSKYDSDTYLMVNSGEQNGYLPYTKPWTAFDNFRSEVLPKTQREIDENTAYRNWRGKTWAAYGDSITTYATNQSDGKPGWGDVVNNYHGFSQFYMRGIGGASFAYSETYHGGAVAFVNPDGSLHSRDSQHNYDNYTGTIPAGTTKIRSAFCSWLRITSMFPESIKDTIDMVFVMGGTNDASDDTMPTWVVSSTADHEWAASEQYQQFNGDYNISTIKGGIASTVLKIHAWMPNAKIIIGTPFNGCTLDAGHNRPDITPAEFEKSKQVIDGARFCGCPVIDVFGCCGVNTANSAEYIYDGAHPNIKGREMIGKCVAGGLRALVS